MRRLQQRQKYSQPSGRPSIAAVTAWDGEACNLLLALSMTGNDSQSPQGIGIFERACRLWWCLQGERPLLIVFWPQDYTRGKVYEINGRRYRIARYVRAKDGRFFEVWGCKVDGAS